LRPTDTSGSTSPPRPIYDNALLYWGVGGNIGDRDQAVFLGYSFGLIEGQDTKGDFGSWRTFVYDYQTGNANRTSIRTDGGSTAFANPTVTALRAPNGQPAILVSLFFPSEGAAPVNQLPDLLGLVGPGQRGRCPKPSRHQTQRE
jgi:hypothetical protein